MVGDKHKNQNYVGTGKEEWGPQDRGTEVFSIHLLKLTNIFNKVAGYRFDIQKSIASLGTNNKLFFKN